MILCLKLWIILIEIKIINFEKREKKFVSYAINSVFIENLLDEKKIVFQTLVENDFFKGIPIEILLLMVQFNSIGPEKVELYNYEEFIRKNSSIYETEEYIESSGSDDDLDDY